MGKKREKRERKERELEDREWELEQRERLALDREAVERERAAAAVQPLPGLERLAPDPAAEIAALRQRSGRLSRAAPAGAPASRSDAVFLAAREIVSRVAGAQLVYGEPVIVEGRTVIPVARVKARGGLGFGNGQAETGEGSGGGGGGILSAAPVGYIDVTANGSAYTAIGGGGGRSAAAGAAGAAAAFVAAAGIAVLGVRRRVPAAGLRRTARRLRR